LPKKKCVMLIKDLLWPSRVWSVNTIAHYPPTYLVHLYPQTDHICEDSVYSMSLHLLSRSQYPSEHGYNATVKWPKCEIKLSHHRGPRCLYNQEKHLQAFVYMHQDKAITATSHHQKNFQYLNISFKEL